MKEDIKNLIDEINAQYLYEDLLNEILEAVEKNANQTIDC